MVLCRCDRELDLYTADRITIVRYVLWRILRECTETDLQALFTLSPSIVRDVLTSIGAASVKLPGTPRLFFSRAGSAGPEKEAFIADTFARLVKEAEEKFRPLLILIDGLEKVPPASFDKVVAAFVRSPELDGCQSVVVVPTWQLQGRDRQGAFGDVDIFEIPVGGKFLFVRHVLERRLVGNEDGTPRPPNAKAIGEKGATVMDRVRLQEIALLSGGIARDGLELAAGACRAALADRVLPVTSEHVEMARREMVRAYQRIFSDDPERVSRFLDHVRKTGKLPGDPEWRDTLLGCGAVLPLENNAYRVHPILVSAAEESRS